MTKIQRRVGTILGVSFFLVGTFLLVLAETKIAVGVILLFMSHNMEKHYLKDGGKEGKG